jgi:hypothetical protein
MAPLSAAPFLALPASGPMTTTMSSKNGVVVGSIFSRRSRAVGSALDVIEWPQRRHTPRGGQIRANARGCDGCIREELAA